MIICRYFHNISISNGSGQSLTTFVLEETKGDPQGNMDISRWKNNESDKSRPDRTKA